MHLLLKGYIILCQTQMRKTKKLFQFYAVTEREREDEYKEELRKKKYLYFWGKEY